MLLEYYGPKPRKVVDRFWGKVYVFEPFCEVDDDDAKVLLAECKDIFRLPTPGAPEAEPPEPVPQDLRPPEDGEAESPRIFASRRGRPPRRRG